jgi:TIR domain/PAN domain
VTDIFFSYSSADRERVRPIRDALVAQGFEVFWDQEVPTGLDWDSWIRQHLTKSKCAIAFWSAASVASKNVRHEARIADEQGKLIPVLLEPLTTQQFPMGLHAQQAANLVGWNGDLNHDEWRKLRREYEAKLMPPWVRQMIDEKDAELVSERARRQGAERRDKILQAQIAKEAETQQELKRDLDSALDEGAALKATVDTLTRVRSEAESREADNLRQVAALKATVDEVTQARSDAEQRLSKLRQTKAKEIVRSISPFVIAAALATIGIWTYQLFWPAPQPLPAIISESTMAAEREQSAIREDQLRQAAADTQAKLEAAEDEQQRLTNEVQRQIKAAGELQVALQRQGKLATDADAKRKVAEDEQQRLKDQVQRQAKEAAELEAKLQQAAQTEQQRQAKAVAEAQTKLQSELQNQTKATTEADKRRKAAEDEQQRLTGELQRQIKAATDADTKRQAAEKAAADADSKRKTAEDEQQRLKAEVQRLTAATGNADTKRRDAEAEQQRLTEELRKVRAEAVTKQVALLQTSSTVMPPYFESRPNWEAVDKMPVGSERVSTVQACQEKCTQSGTCRAFTINKTSNLCFLYDLLPNFRSSPNFDSGVRLSAAPSQSPSIVTSAFTLRPTMRASRAGDRSSFARTTDDCQDKCARLGTCVAFTFDSSSDACYMYNSIPNFLPAADSVSGVRN